MGGGGVFHFCFDFLRPSELHEVSLSLFFREKITPCTIHKDNHDVNHHRQRLDLTLKINARFVFNLGNIYRILT